MRLLHLLEDDTMKINEVQIQEAEPNYETDPAQARLSAIAVKLMDKAGTVSDENLQIALSRVAQHLPEYGTAFGAKNMQDLLDIVNGEGKYFDPDMPQDNKNPIKITKESLMKMMAFGQQMVDKEGTVQPDIKEDDTADYEKVNARQMHKQLRTLIKDIAILNGKINEISDIDNGDLTDQITTMFKHVQGLYAVVGRAQKIVPIYEGEMNEAIPTSEFDYDLKKFYDKVMELEDQNQHGEVAEMLVNLYGTSPESMVIRGINGMHSAQGSIMPEQQRLRDMISTKYYKKLEQEVEQLKKTSPAYTMNNEGVISDLFKSTTAEKRAKDQNASAYDAMRLEKETKKFAKQGLSPDDARKYAYRKVYGKPLGEGKLSMNKIHKAVDDGKSMDAIVGMFANKGTTNTDDIRKIVKDYKFKSRMKK